LHSFRPTSGIPADRTRRPCTPDLAPTASAGRGLVAALAACLLLSGCLYGFQAGAGFPSHVKTVAIVPFENETNRPELTDEVFQMLLREFPRSQGLQPAGEEVADAVIRGKIRRYDLSTPSYRPGAAGETPQVLQRQVTLMVEVQIVNLVDNTILWESPGISVMGQYLEETESEDVGRALAIELLIQRIVDGAQENW